MIATGIVKRMDDLGRIHIPKEIRKRISASEGTPIEVFLQGDTIILKKYRAADDYLAAVGDLENAIYDYEGIENLQEIRQHFDEIKSLLLKNN